MLQQGVRTGGESIVRSRRSPASLSTAAVRNAAVRERGGAGDAVVRAGPRDDAHCVGALLLARERCSCCSRGSARAARASCGVGGQRACPQHPAAVRSGPADDAHGVGALLLVPERCSCCSRGSARAARASSGVGRHRHPSAPRRCPAPPTMLTLSVRRSWCLSDAHAEAGGRQGGESIVRLWPSLACLSTASGAGGPADDAHGVGALLLARERCSCCSRGSARAARASCGRPSSRRRTLPSHNRSLMAGRNISTPGSDRRIPPIRPGTSRPEQFVLRCGELVLAEDSLLLQ